MYDWIKSYINFNSKKCVWWSKQGEGPCYTRTQKGELVALDFLDMSAGFDSLIHLYILRKMDIQFGMDEDSLEWVSSYIKG